jgi:hypothetical protein
MDEQRPMPRKGGRMSALISDSDAIFRSRSGFSFEICKKHGLDILGEPCKVRSTNKITAKFRALLSFTQQCSFGSPAGLPQFTATGLYAHAYDQKHW